MRKPLSFRFNQQWTKIEKVKEIVKKNWKTTVNGSRQFKVVSRLKKIKLAIKEWNRKHNIYSMKNLDNNQAKLKVLEEKLMENPNNENILKHYERVLKQREKILLFNQKYWRNMARKDWLTKGDRNSSYFHKNLTGRKKKSRVYKVRDNYGEWLEDKMQIRDYFVKEFKKRSTLEAQSTRTVHIEEFQGIITEDDNKELLKEITNDEIKIAFNQINAHKSPGPDGFGATFFHEY